MWSFVSFLERNQTPFCVLPWEEVSLGGDYGIPNQKVVGRYGNKAIRSCLHYSCTLIFAAGVQCKMSAFRVNHYTFTLKMASAMFAETLDDFKHSTWLIPEIQCFTLNHLDGFVSRVVWLVPVQCERCQNEATSPGAGRTVQLVLHQFADEPQRMHGRGQRLHLKVTKQMK
jgi:hypothetical protein